MTTTESGTLPGKLPLLSGATGFTCALTKVPRVGAETLHSPVEVEVEDGDFAV